MPSKPSMVEHSFTKEIMNVLTKRFGEYAKDIFEASALLGYLNIKTKSANRGSKARGAFANHYAIYVVIEDYLNKGFGDGTAESPYSKYEGARYSDLLTRQRKLPFGTKLQNHALNARLNDEFKKFYPSVGKIPIIRHPTNQRYWIQEDLVQISVRLKDGSDHVFNIGAAVIDIIDAYIATKMAAFDSFLESCREIAELGKKDHAQAIQFVVQQLQPNVDARVFEIVSYAVLKARFGQQTRWIGLTQDSVTEEVLMLYKTGRTNANDGGIDFVMRPLGRFFQVTETIDVKKYFLDIDKVQRFPITFVVKSSDSSQKILETIRAQAVALYKIEAVVESYLNAVEEVINVPYLLDAFEEVLKSGLLPAVMDEIVTQSKVEFNYSDEEEEVEEALESLGIVEELE